MPPTIRDVANLAGTSASAVSAVLSPNGRHNIRVGNATRERILAARDELRFSPNPLAQSLATRRTGILGLAFPYSSAFIDHNPFCSQVLSGVLEEAVRQQYNLMLHTAAGDDWNASESTALADPRVDGLILVLPAPRSAVPALCRQRGFPYVALVTEPGTDDCAVNADEFGGGYLATEHLLHLGHRRIAHLMGDPRIASTEPRKQGYLAALEAAGVAPEPALLEPAGFSSLQGYEGLHRMLDQRLSPRPTAVFAANDLCAEGALRALRERGLRVPDDVALVGYDDTWFAATTQPALTSVHMPIYEMGAAATRHLIAQLEKREKREKVQEASGEIVLPVSLTVRESCGASGVHSSERETRQ